MNTVRSISKKQLLIFAFLFITLVLAVFFVQKQQETRQHATGSCDTYPCVQFLDAHSSAPLTVTNSRDITLSIGYRQQTGGGGGAMLPLSVVKQAQAQEAQTQPQMQTQIEDEGAAPSEDSDHDGFSNTVEVAAGTNPNLQCPTSPTDNAWPPDYNNSGAVTAADSSLQATVFGTAQGDSNYNPRYDLNGDHRIDIVDFSLLRAYFDRRCSDGPVSSSTPTEAAATATTQPSATVVPGATKVRFAETSDLTGAPERDFASDPLLIPYTLSDGFGPKIVYVEFFVNGAWTSKISSTIDYQPEPTAPTTTSTLPPGQCNNDSQCLPDQACQTSPSCTSGASCPKYCIQSPTGDSDHDGFSNAVEAVAGTNPNQQCPSTAAPNAWPPDYNNSGLVDGSDFSMQTPVFGTSQGDSNFNPRYDLNGDHRIDIEDFSLLRAYFNRRCSDGPLAAATPTLSAGQCYGNNDCSANQVCSGIGISSNGGDTPGTCSATTQCGSDAQCPDGYFCPAVGATQTSGLSISYSCQRGIRPSPTLNPQADSDNDGFSNAVETAAGTNPNLQCPTSPTDNAWPPDFNNNGIVDGAQTPPSGDFGLFLQHFGTSQGDASYNKRFDVNGDGGIDTIDFSIFRRYFGRHCSDGSLPPVTPTSTTIQPNQVCVPSTDTCTAGHSCQIMIQQCMDSAISLCAAPSGQSCPPTPTQGANSCTTVYGCLPITTSTPIPTAIASITTTALIDGDVDRNSCIDIRDYNNWLSAFITAPTPFPTNIYPDIDADGTVTVIDFNIWLTALKGGQHECTN